MPQGEPRPRQVEVDNHPVHARTVQLGGLSPDVAVSLAAGAIATGASCWTKTGSAWRCSTIALTPGCSPCRRWSRGGPAVAGPSAADAETPEEGRGPFMLRIRSGEGPARPGHPYGTGVRQTLAGGQRLAFWMTGSEAETAAFRNSPPEGPPGKQATGALGQRRDGPMEPERLAAGQSPAVGIGHGGELLGIEPQIGTVTLKMQHGGESAERWSCRPSFPTC